MEAAGLTTATDEFVLSPEHLARRNAAIHQVFGYVAIVAMQKSTDPFTAGEPYFYYIDECLVRPPAGIPPLSSSDRFTLYDVHASWYLGYDELEHRITCGISFARYREKCRELTEFIGNCLKVLPLPDVVVSPADQERERHLTEIRGALGQLGFSDRDSTLVIDLYSGLKTRRQIAREQGITHFRIGDIVNDAVKQLRAMPNAAGTAWLDDLAATILGKPKQPARQRPKKEAHQSAGVQSKVRRPTQAKPAKISEPEKSEDEIPASQLANLQREPLLRAEEEVELAKLIEAGLYAEQLLKHVPETVLADPSGDLQEIAREGQAAYQRFIRANSGLVRYFIIRARLKIQEGGIRDIFSIEDYVTDNGLGPAVQRFDFTLGYKFSTYAGSAIRMAIDEAIAASQPFTINRQTYSLMKRLVAYRLQFYEENQRHITNEKLAKHFNISVNRVSALLLTSFRINSIRSKDERRASADDSTSTRIVEETMADDKAPTEDMLVNRLMVRGALERLTGQERFVVEHHFGLNDRPIVDEPTIARRLNRTTVGRVRRLLKSALAKLHSALGELQ